MPQRPTERSSQTFLKMAEDMISWTNNDSGKFSIRSQFDEANNVGVGSNSNGFPLSPRSKTQQRSFVKDKTNPISVPRQKGDRHHNRILTDSQNTQAKVVNLGLLNSQEAEMKMLADVNYDNSGYLTPMDPPPYMESSLDFSSSDFPSSPTDSETGSNSFHKRNKPMQRFDSGVGDVESIQGSSSARFSNSPSSSSNSTYNPRLSVQHEQHYEDIDQYNKSSEFQQHQSQHRPQRQPQHEPQHQPPRINMEKFKEDSLRNGVRQLPHVDISGVTQSDTEDSDPILKRSLAEAVSDPMHDPRIGSLPHTYMPLTTNKQQMDSPRSSNEKRCRCWFFIFPFIILLISLTALSLSIYILASKHEYFQREHPENPLMPGDFNLSKLQQKVDDLMKENTALRNALLAQENNLTSYVEQKVAELSTQQQNLSNVLHLMDVKFDAEIANISLTPGPQGPPGVVNFSLCVSRTVTESAAAHLTSPTVTSYLPTETEIQKYFVTFAYCTYSGATDAYLETQLSNTNNRLRYRCKCWGMVPQKTQTLCTANVWMCPQ